MCQDREKIWLGTWLNLGDLFTADNNFPRILLLVWLTQFFWFYKFPHFSDHHREKIIVVAIFFNFLWIFEVRKISTMTEL